ncbi:MAG: alkaline phosphatase D family protein [Verrucomicrobiae bacterium]|nr:alkaline phosphatase D family protein [Verrucomicrobiae bacterium]
MAVEPEWDFTRQHVIQTLTPATRYEIEVESRSLDDSGAGDTQSGSFVTAPAADDAATPVVFTVSTGQAFRDRNSDEGYLIYDAMLAIPDLSFFVHTGDIVYYDREAKTRDLANWHWQRTYSLPTNVRFHRQVASYFIKDDHDTWTNDCWSTMKAPSMGTFTWAEGLALFPHQVPMNGDNTIRTRRWGKHLQVWMVEGRDFRSPNTDPDGPEKTIWGAEQKAWFKKSFAESDATFRILISPTPLVGPDRDNKNDNHANRGFTHEGDEIRAFLSEQKDAFVVCGDRHWQYHSIHPKSGVQEFSCGPASEKHAGGWQKSDFREDYHQFLRVQGGFLSVRTESIDDTPTLTFRFHDESGEVDYEKSFTPTKP